VLDYRVRATTRVTRYTVFVDDNRHYMQTAERYVAGVFDSEEAAVAAARAIVDRSLAECYRPGQTAEALYRCYVELGEDPWISPATLFSAWQYAQARARELCEQKPPASLM
jgi:hypothetical protein